MSPSQPGSPQIDGLKIDSTFPDLDANLPTGVLGSILSASLVGMGSKEASQQPSLWINANALRHRLYALHNEIVFQDRAFGEDIWHTCDKPEEKYA